MDNDVMRDVVEHMKNKAQREGRQQKTISNPALPEDYDEKAVTKRRRIRENLSMAHSAMKMVDESLTKAEKYTEEDSEDQQLVRSLCIAAESLRQRIWIALDEMAAKEVQGE